MGYVEGLNDARTMLADFFSSLLVSLADLNKTDRVAHQRRLVVAFPSQVGHSMPMTPFCNPYDFLCRSRDKAGLRELSHTTCNQSTHDAALCIKFQRIEGKRIASTIRQR